MCRIARVARWRKRVAPVGNAGGGLLALLQHIGHHLQPGAHGRRRGKDEEVPVAPEKAALAVPVQRVARGQQEVHPPQRKRQHGAAQADQRQVQRPAKALPHACHRVGGAQHHLAQRDDEQQAVALSNVVGVPGRAVPAFGHDRHRQLARHEQHEGGPQPFHREPQPRDPQRLHQRDAEREAAAGGGARRVAARGQQPLHHQRQPHHRIVQHASAKIAVEQPRHAGREDQHAHRLQHGPQAEHGAVVVGRGKPGVVHPRPPDGRERGHKAGQRRAGVVLHHAVVQLRGGQRDGDHEAQVEQQLQRGRHAVLFVDVASARPSRGRRGKRGGGVLRWRVAGSAGDGN